MLGTPARGNKGAQGDAFGEEIVEGRINGCLAG
jgi:hypothetical protein